MNTSSSIAPTILKLSIKLVNDKPLAPLVLSPEKEAIFHSGHSEILVESKNLLFIPES
jgi:hypothetical protein